MFGSTLLASLILALPIDEIEEPAPSPSPELVELFQDTCKQCHANLYFDDEGELDWEAVLANAENIMFRLDPNTPSRQRMPPFFIAEQPSEELRLLVIEELFQALLAAEEDLIDTGIDPIFD